LKEATDYPEFEAFFEALAGASQAFKLGATDGQIHAVKFREKAQFGALGLARELLAAKLAFDLGVQVPEASVLRLTQEYLDVEPRLVFNDGTRPAPGIASGSRFLPPAEDLPTDHSARLASCPFSDVAGIIVFNTWVGCDDRSWNNYAFTIDGATPRFASIDYASAFARTTNADPLVHDVAEVQSAAKGFWADVEVAISRAEKLPEATIDAALRSVPSELWSDDDRDSTGLMLRASTTRIRAALEAIRR
jgi:hypothetical protein